MRLTPHYITTKTCKIEYYRLGTGSPLILLAGFAAGVSSWNKRFIYALAKEHELYLLNNRGVGLSSHSHGSYFASDLAEDILTFINELNLQQPALLGLSMGGIIAQQFAMLYADKISALILMNTVFKGPHVTEPAQAVYDFILKTPSSLWQRFIAALKLISPPAARLNVAYQLIIDHIVTTNGNETLTIPEATLVKQRELILDWVKEQPLAHAYRDITCKTLVLAGVIDALVPYSDSVAIANAIPHATLKTYPLAGHALNIQFPHLVATDINHFLK